MITKDAPIPLTTQEIPRVLGSLCHKQDKSEDIFPAINHNIRAGLRETNKGFWEQQWWGNFYQSLAQRGPQPGIEESNYRPNWRVGRAGKINIPISLFSRPPLSFHGYHWLNSAKDRAQEGSNDAIHTGQPSSAQSRVEKLGEQFLSTVTHSELLHA